jgi:hypothetical protein
MIRRMSNEHDPRPRGTRVTLPHWCFVYVCQPSMLTFEDDGSVSVICERFPRMRWWAIPLFRFRVWRAAKRREAEKALKH